MPVGKQGASNAMGLPTRRSKSLPQVTGTEGRLDDEIAPITVHERELTQVTGATGRLDDEVGPITIYKEPGSGLQISGTLKNRL